MMVDHGRLWHVTTVPRRQRRRGRFSRWEDWWSIAVGSLSPPYSGRERWGGSDRRGWHDGGNTAYRGNCSRRWISTSTWDYCIMTFQTVNTQPNGANPGQTNVTKCSYTFWNKYSPIPFQSNGPSCQSIWNHQGLIHTYYYSPWPMWIWAKTAKSEEWTWWAWGGVWGGTVSGVRGVGLSSWDESSSRVGTMTSVGGPCLVCLFLIPGLLRFKSGHLRGCNNHLHIKIA